MEQTSQMELSLQIDPGAAAARPRRQRVLIGFAEALAAIETAWSLDEAGFEVLAFARRGRRPPLRRSRVVTLHELAPPDLDAATAEADLRALIESAAVDAVMPIDDIALRLCLRPCREAGVTMIGPTGSQAELA